MTWLERHKEIIINGLDLLSFLLVTPEVLRVIRPALRITTFVVVAAVAFPTLVVAVEIGVFFGVVRVGQILDWRSPVWNFIGPILAFIIIILSLAVPLRILIKITNRDMTQIWNAYPQELPRTQQ